MPALQNCPHGGSLCHHPHDNALRLPHVGVPCPITPHQPSVAVPGWIPITPLWCPHAAPRSPPPPTHGSVPLQRLRRPQADLQHPHSLRAAALGVGLRHRAHGVRERVHTRCPDVLSRAGRRHQPHAGEPQPGDPQDHRGGGRLCLQAAPQVRPWGGVTPSQPASSYFPPPQCSASSSSPYS